MPPGGSRKPRAVKAAINHWLVDQSARIRNRAKIALEDGLKAPEYALRGGAREPRVIVEMRETPEWPDSFDTGAARLSIADADALLARSLRLLLENGRNDWAFLTKVVPEEWRAKWDKAVTKRWIEEHNAGGITEMRRIIEEQLAFDPVRRLRTWAMFDSDGLHARDASQQSEDTRRACETWGVVYHRLQRRAIENYIPRESLYDWAFRRRHKADRDEMVARVRAHHALAADEERHYLDMKERFHTQLAQHVWSDGEVTRDGHVVIYEITEVALASDGSGPEREQLFQSLFSRL